MNSCVECGNEVVNGRRVCLRCMRKHDKLRAAHADIRRGVRSMASACAQYGVSSVQVVQWIARHGSAAQWNGDPDLEREDLAE